MINRIVSACFLILALRGAGIASADSAVSSAEPGLASAYGAFVNADAQGKEPAFQSFFTQYLPLVSTGQGLDEWNAAIVRFLEPDRRSTLVARLCADGVDSSLQAACVAANAEAGLSEYVGARAAAAEALYLARPSAGDARPEVIARRLGASYRFFKSKPAAERLGKALAASGDTKAAFRFKLYRYLDESNPNPVRGLWLQVLKLATPGLGSWGEELDSAARAIVLDTVRSSPQSSTFPIFDSDTLRDEAGEKVFLSFVDERSTLRGSKAAFIFFKTTCSYCAEELKAIDRYAKRRPAGAGIPAIVGIGIPSGLPGPFDSIAPFKKKLGIALPLLKPDSMAMAEAYSVHSVPFILLFNEGGRVEASISLGEQKNLDNKIAWLFDAFARGELNPSAWSVGLAQEGETMASRAEALASAPVPAAPSAGTPEGKAPVAIGMTLYYDPACASCEEFLESGIPEIEDRNGVSIRVERKDIMGKEAFDELARTLAERGATLAATPVAVIGGEIFQGLSDIADGTANAASRASRGEERAVKRTAGQAGESAIPALSVVPVFFAGLADGINPCAFSTLLFLISMISRAGKKRRDVLLIGSIYTATVFASYFALGIGLFSSLRAASAFASVSKIIRVALSLTLGVFAALSFRDAYLELKGKRSGMTLVLPRRNKELIHKAIRDNLRLTSIIAGTMVTAFLVSVFELACTGQIYLPVIAWIVRSGDVSRGIGLLALYNIGFIVPLGVIFALAWAGVSLKPITDRFSKNIWTIKLGLGIVFCVFLVLNLAL